MIDIKDIISLYKSPFPSTRTGALFNTFSYPTKISPEAIALFIACHTEVGDTIFDPFGGSGTTGIAAKLCDKPTTTMLNLAKQYGVTPKWGKRNAIIYELSPIASSIGEVLCSAIPSEFLKYSNKLLEEVESNYGYLYNVEDPEGNDGSIRYVIWTDSLRCPYCHKESYYSDLAIQYQPIRFVNECTCPHCQKSFKLEEAEKCLSEVNDPCLNREIISKKRSYFKIYGKTGKKSWSRLATAIDNVKYTEIIDKLDFSNVPIQKMVWGDLYRSGYHTGIDYIHQMYTLRNVFIFSKLWEKTNEYPESIKKALRIFLLSYNQSHSTLMTRVVAKKENKDFVITGAQPGVLYISSLPVEKNIFEGLRRKVKTFVDALKLLEGSDSKVMFYNRSSINTTIQSQSIDYVFTDPPFGDYIPYSEINQLNEAWLGVKTNPDDEVIISDSQNKSIDSYQNLMSAVFSEVSRCLKPNGLCTVVFHSAKSAIWRAIINSYQDNNLVVEKTGVLDKVQASFKQVNSNITVKGDPLILLSKNSRNRIVKKVKRSDREIAEAIKTKYKDEIKSKKKSEKMFSEYIAICIEEGVVISLDANYFFNEQE